MTTPPHAPGRPPAFNMSLTHVTLPSAQVQVNRLTELINEITLGTDVIVIVVSPATHLAETDVDQSRFIWPTWQGETIPEAHQKWKAVFATRDRTFRGIYYEGPTLEETQTFRVPNTVLSDAMWKMTQNAPCAVLCTGLTGDPSSRNHDRPGRRKAPSSPGRSPVRLTSRPAPLHPLALHDTTHARPARPASPRNTTQRRTPDTMDLAGHRSIAH
jgi:hypothetical protein